MRSLDVIHLFLIFSAVFMLSLRSGCFFIIKDKEGAPRRRRAARLPSAEGKDVHWDLTPEIPQLPI
jgi:hypothetical protein